LHRFRPARSCEAVLTLVLGIDDIFHDPAAARVGGHLPGARAGIAGG
jgi:hypothetical protein